MCVCVCVRVCVCVGGGGSRLCDKALLSFQVLKSFHGGGKSLLHYSKCNFDFICVYMFVF